MSPAAGSRVRRTAASGFTQDEEMIALVVLSIGLMAMLGLVPLGAR